MEGFNSYMFGGKEVVAKPLVQNTNIREAESQISSYTGISLLELPRTDLPIDLSHTQLFEHISEETDAEDFTFAIIPDTQNMVQYPDNNVYFESMAQYLVDNQGDLNLVFTTHVGDIVQEADDTTEWDVADRIMGVLDTANIPYSVTPGNHDLAGYSGNPSSEFNTYFGPDRFMANGYYQGSYEDGKNENNFSFFSVSGLDFIVINLQHDPLDDHIEWANQLLQNNPDRIGILVSHYIINKYGNYSSMGQAIYDGVKTNPNLLFMICGHLTRAGYRAELRPELGTVHIIMADYQSDPHGGNGYLRLLRFSPQSNTVYMTTYSDILNQYISKVPHQMNFYCWLPSSGTCFKYYLPSYVHQELPNQ